MASRPVSKQNCDTIKRIESDSLRVDTLLAADFVVKWKMLCDRYGETRDAFSLAPMKFGWKPLARPWLYFSVCDYGEREMLQRVSRYSFPVATDAALFRYLWSGGATQFRETGFPAGYYDGERRGLMFYFIRRDRKLQGIRLRVLEPND